MSVSYYGEYKQRKQDGVWHFLNRLMFVLIVFVVITLIICFFLPMLRRQKELADRQEDLKRQIAEQSELYAQHTRQEDWLKDPEYVATLARDRLDLMKPDEMILRMDPQPASGAQRPKSQPRQ